MLAVLVSVAIAAPPDLPVRGDPVEGECEEAIPIHADDGNPSCSGILVPTSEVAYLLELQTYAEKVSYWYDADVAALNVDLANARNDSLRAQKRAKIFAAAAGVIAVGAAVGIAASR